MTPGIPPGALPLPRRVDIMLCEVCHQNEATIHIKEVRDGKVISHDLCASCAKLKESQGELGVLGFNLAEVLFNLGKLAPPAAERQGKNAAGSADRRRASEAAQEQKSDDEAEALPPCPACGWTAERLCESTLLGCPECYHAFAPLIGRAVERFQRGEFHLGKRPGAAAAGKTARLAEIAKLKRELARLVGREEYEAAAVCRDRINALRASLDEDAEAAEA